MIDLTPMGKENLVLVIEECAEVIHAATKMLRFGIDGGHSTHHNGKPNIWCLTEEVGQLFHCIDRLELDAKHVLDSSSRKQEKLKIYGPGGSHYD